MESNRFVAPLDDLYLTTELEHGQLPLFLEKAISVAELPTQQDMLLLGTLTTASFALPHVRILHGNPQHSYSPALMTLVVAPPAAGKGVLNYMHQLISPIEDKLKLRGKTAVIPANSSSAAFLDLLAMNDGAGLMIETEMDVLSQIWKNDFGNYSHLFRQAFEHESIRRARKSGAHALNYTEIPTPNLSAILSGTPNQLKPLLVNRENGLASRFLPYMVEDIIPFDRRALKNGDRVQENSAVSVFHELGKELLQRWEWLASREHDILWSLTDEQSEQLGDLFDDGYRLAMEELHLPDSFDATVKRMAVIIKRIGAILTMLRQEPGECSDVVYCQDEDFRTLVMLSEKLLRHAALMTLMLPDEEEKWSELRPESEARHQNVENRACELYGFLPEKFSTSEAYATGLERMGIKSRTVDKYLGYLVENEKLSNQMKGQYEKTKQ